MPGLSERAQLIGFKEGLSTITIRHVRYITRGRGREGGNHDGDTGRRCGHIENGEEDPSSSLLGNRPDSQEVPEKGVMIITRTGNWNCTEYTEYGVRELGSNT